MLNSNLFGENSKKNIIFVHFDLLFEMQAWHNKTTREGSG